ncbi:NAD(P)/FAD-dependent oxidoreductase [Microbacterium sp.]|uniref:NAD(P)/FAD-dependent oxidoreductase n=1 Tax=Microbacterium sp. TaxID=51671 RepID=UPI0033421E83
MEWDAIILGGGAAGLSAGIVLARTGVKTVLVDDRTPRNAVAAHMHGFLSRDGMDPAELLQSGRREMIGFGGRILAASAVRAEERAEGGFQVTLDEGSELRAPALLVATGLSDGLPQLPGVRELWGDSVHHCPHCHGREVAGRRIVVIGGDNAMMSVHQAALLRRYSDDVVFCTNGIVLEAGARARLEAVGVVIDPVPVTAVARDPRTGGIVLSQGKGRALACDAVFVAPVMEPRAGMVEGLDLVRAAGGWIETGPTGRTSVDGVWAAGNVSNPRAQVITAAGEGSAAAIDMTGFLLERDLGRALTGDRNGWYSR